MDDIVPDYLDMNVMIRIMAQAKGNLTRRTRTFLALVEGDRPYTREELADARVAMVTACDAMVLELNQYVQMQYPLDNPHYIDGRRRETQCMEHYGAVYAACLQGFDNVSQNQDNAANLPPPPSIRASELSSIGDQTAELLQEQLARREARENAALARQQRARARRIRTQELQAQAQRDREQAQREREQAQRERELAALRQQELDDQEEEEAENLRRQQALNRERLSETLSRSGRTASHRSRASTVHTRRSRQPLPIIPGSRGSAASQAGSEATQRSLNLLLEGDALPPARIDGIAPAIDDELFHPLAPPLLPVQPPPRRLDPLANLPQQNPLAPPPPIPQPRQKPRQQEAPVLQFPLIPADWGIQPTRHNAIQGRPENQQPPQPALPQHNPDPQPALPQHNPDPQPALPRHNPDPQPALPRRNPDPRPPLPRRNPDPRPVSPRRNPDPPIPEQRAADNARPAGLGDDLHPQPAHPLQNSQHQAAMEAQLQFEERRAALEASRAAAQLAFEERKAELEARQTADAKKRTVELERQVALARQLTAEQEKTRRNELRPSRDAHLRPQSYLQEPPVRSTRTKPRIGIDVTAHTSIGALANRTCEQYIPLPDPLQAAPSASSSPKITRAHENLGHNEPPMPKPLHAAPPQSSPPINDSQPSAAEEQNRYLTLWIQQSLQGPNRQLFKGTSLDYPRFIMEYQRSALKLQSNPGMCQQVLMSLLDPSGMAYKLVKPYFGNPDPDKAAESLENMLEILKMTYGTGRKQSRAQLDALLARSKVAATEEGLIEFYSELNSCFVVMKNCDRTADLDTESTLKTLFLKLPDYIQIKWDKQMKHTGETKPTFEQLMKVIKEEHTRKTGELSQWHEEARSKKRESKDKNKNDPKHKVPPSAKINNFAIRGAGNSQAPPAWPLPQPSNPTPTCLCGPNGTHNCVANCPIYVQTTTVDDRWALLKQNGHICFRCLKLGHKANRCHEGSCQTNGCESRHHITLHRNQSRNRNTSRSSSNRVPRGQGQSTDANPNLAPLGANPHALPFPPPPSGAAASRSATGHSS